MQLWNRLGPLSYILLWWPIIFFLTPLQVKVHLYGWDAYLPTLHNLLQPKICYMGNDECKIHLDAMREVYMLEVLNLKMSCGRYPSLTGNPCNDELKIGDLVLIKNQTPQSPFDARYKPSYWIIKKTLVTRHSTCETPRVKWKESLQGTYNSCTLQNIMWQHSPKWKYLGELQNLLTTPV